MPALAAMAAVVVCYGLALLLARRHRLLALASLALLAASAWMVFAYPRPFEHNPHELEITAIDIGQGDSFLVVTPDGHTLLLDSGGLLGMSHSDLDIGEDVVSPYLWQRGLRPSGRGRLQPQPLGPHRRNDGDPRAISIPANSGMRRTIPRTRWNRYLRPPTGCMSRRIERHHGESFDFDGVHFEVLSPPAVWELKPRGQDDASMVLRLSYAGHTALLVGDIHKRMEKMLVEESEERHAVTARRSAQGGASRLEYFVVRRISGRGTARVRGDFGGDTKSVSPSADRR